MMLVRTFINVKKTLVIIPMLFFIAMNLMTHYLDSWKKMQLNLLLLCMLNTSVWDYKLSSFW
jgi:hypothetical protein